MLNCPKILKFLKILLTNKRLNWRLNFFLSYFIIFLNFLKFFTGVDCDVINTLTLIKENDANFSELFEDGLKKIIDDYYGVKTDEPKKNEKVYLK